jgi:PUA-domain protein
MTIKIKNKHSLKSKEIKEFFSEVKKKFLIDFYDNNVKVETGFIDDIKMIFIDDEPCFMMIDGKLFFTLQGVMKFKPPEKFIIVDMGAVKFITSGADLMAPGIVNADGNIQKDDHVWICDEHHKKPLATGIAIMNGEEMIREKKGKSVKIIHYVGDKYWNLSKKS